VGGVAATRLRDGVISPGGIGFDINCGVRLLVSQLRQEAVAPSIEPLIHEISRSIPAGYGRKGRLSLTRNELDHVLDEGCPYLFREHGIGHPEDSEYIESGGALPGAEAGQGSDRAKVRGADQLGTLGGGNHFVEVQVVEAIHDEAVARQFGLFVSQIAVLVHTGSRGLGHQVCTDHVRIMDSAVRRYGISLPDRQLACAPLSSPEGHSYHAAMAAAANFGFCNRQVIAHRVREVFRRLLATPEAELRLVYDVAHNTAKIERYGRRPCACTARARPARSVPRAPSCPRPIEASGSRCSSPAAWEPPRTSSSARTRPGSSPSPAPATGRDEP
jgi:tRNA-splicing ligase RtcB